MKNALTTLAVAKDYCLGAGISGTSTASDRTFTRLVNGVSQQVLSYLNRDSFASQQFTDEVDGPGGPTMFLKNWPVTSITSVVVNGQVITQVDDNTGGAWGYKFETWNGLPPGNPSALEGSNGFRFWQGHLNVKVVYTAGYLVANEAATIPTDTGSNYQVIAEQPYGSWIFDNGVTYANGTPLTFVTSSPAQGQYSIATPTVDSGTGIYQFAQADAGTGVLLSYSFVPSDVEQCVLDLILDAYSRRSRPGMKSSSMSGLQTATYDTSGMPQYAQSILNNYMDVLPH